MKKEKIKEHFKNLIVNDKVYGSVIFSGSNEFEVKNLTKDIARMFFCLNRSLIFDECLACKKFKNNNIVDFLEIGDGNTTIAKNEILSLINNFSLTSIESFNKKIYLINTAENLKDGAANALLKFLEEPPHNTFAFLITKNSSQILPTIRSRCNLIFVESEEDLKQEENILLNLLNMNKNEILLKNTELKKMDKSDLISLAEKSYQLIKNNYENTSILELWLEFINDLKFSFAKNLSIDN